MNWIDVNDQLPKNEEEVLALVKGYFPLINNPLTQKTSLRIFEASFCRNMGWNIPDYTERWSPVLYWMPRPENPGLKNE